MGKPTGFLEYDRENNEINIMRQLSGINLINIVRHVEEINQRENNSKT